MGFILKRVYESVIFVYLGIDRILAKSVSLGLRVESSLEAGVLDCVTLLETQVEPVGDASDKKCGPGEGNVPGCWSIDQVASTLSVLVCKNHFRCEDSNCQPSEATFYGLFLSLNGAPALQVDVGLPVGNCAKAEPEEKAGDGEKVLGWN